MIFVGIDWAEEHHDIGVMAPDGHLLGRARVPEGIEGVARLHALVADHADDPGEGTDRHNHRQVAGDSDLAEAIKVTARAHQNLIWTRQRQVNQLRARCLRHRSMYDEQTAWGHLGQNLPAAARHAATIGCVAAPGTDADPPIA